MRPTATTALTATAAAALGLGLLASSAPALAGPPPVGAGSLATAGVAALPAVSAGPANVLEGDDDSVYLTFPVMLSAACDSPASLTYDISPYGADPASYFVDFAATDNEVLGLAAGTVMTWIPVEVYGDTAPEVTEKIKLRIHGFGGCLAGTDGEVAAVGTIFDDDVVTASIDEVEVVEGDAGTTPATLVVSLDQPAPIDGSISIDFGPHTASAGVDWTAAPLEPLVFLEGTQSLEVPIDVIGDEEIEEDEELTVALHSPSFGFEVDPAADLGTVRILDDDAPAVPSGDGTDDPADDSADDGSDDAGTDDGGDDSATDDDAASADDDERPASDEDDAAVVAGTGVERDALPRTGATVGGLGLTGLALVAAGRVLVRFARR